MRYLVIVALLVLTAVPAMGQGSPERQITVNVTVSAFVEIEVINPVLNWTTAGSTPWENDLGGKGSDPTTRARFKVLANAPYTLTVTSSNGTWDSFDTGESTINYAQAKFVNTTDPTKYIGGGLYLCPTPEAGNFADAYYWNTEGGQTNFVFDSGHIVTEARPAGIKIWGISATFSPAYDGNPDTVAEPGVYSTNAVITAAVE